MHRSNNLLRYLAIAIAMLSTIDSSRLFGKSGQTPSDQKSQVTQPNVDGSAQTETTVLETSTETAEAVDIVRRSSDAPTASVPLGITPAGIQRHVTGKWAALAVNGVNRSDSDAEEMIVFTLGGDENNQVSRKVWIPAGARRQAWFPILIPDVPLDATQITGQFIQVTDTEDGETYQANRVGSPTSKRSLLLSPETDEQSAMMIDSIFDGEANEKEEKSLTEMIYAGFDSATNIQQDLGMPRFAAHFLPPTPNPLDSLDQLIIASDSLLNDTVGVARLRQWLNDGGRVWVMADKVSPRSVQALLGDSANFEVLDRVQLNNFTIETLDPFFRTVSLDEAWASETPVDFLRVMTDAADVHSQIDGWPSAFWIPSGKGEIIVTTLGHEGWMLNGQPTETYTALSSRFFIKRDQPADRAELVRKELNREIGYEIPERRLIAVVLGVHFLLTLAAGLYFARQKELHKLGLVLPASVILAVGILLVVGSTNTSAVPSTIAVGQVARAIPDTSQVAIDTTIAVYSQGSQELPLRTGPDTMIRPDSNWASSETRRHQYTDDGVAEWKFLKQPPGKIQHLSGSTRKSSENPWQIQGQFDENGFVGRLNGLDVDAVSDAVVVSSSLPSMGITINSSKNELVGGQGQVLLPGQFYDGALLTEVQRKRQAFIRDLVGTDSTLRTREPTMLIWTDPIVDDIEFPQGFEKRGWTLVSCPINLLPPAAGQSFVIPPGFVKINPFRGDRGVSTLYNPENGQWIESMDRPASVDLSIELPAAVVPCKLTECNVSLHANTPGRVLSVYGYNSTTSEKVPVKEIANVPGLVQFTISDAEVMNLDAKGAFRITLEVSETEEEKENEEKDVDAFAASEPESQPDGLTNDSKSAIPWSIKYLHFNVKGTAM